MRWHVPLLALLLALVLLWQASHIRDALVETRLESAEREGALAVSAIRSAMMAEEMHEPWARVRDNLPMDDQTWLEIITLDGRVLYPADAATSLPTRSLDDAECAACHAGGSREATRRSATVDVDGEEMLLFAAPIENVAECARCHANDGPRLGVVYTRQSLEPANRLLQTTQVGLLAAGLIGLLALIVSTRALFARYLGRPLKRLAEGARAIGRGELSSEIQLSERTELTLLADTLNLSAARQRASLARASEQRDALKTLYYIADQLGRGIEPDVMRRRAVELASKIFTTECVLLQGHFDSDTGAFRGTVTYERPGEGVVERSYPDPEVATTAAFYDTESVERWLAGELDEETRTREGRTVAFPVKRHGRRLGLILAPAGANEGAGDDRATAAHPEVVKAWLKHLGVALELAELQRERLQQERLAAIGETVAGLSHCLKNTLNGLQGGQFVVDRALEQDDCQVLGEGWRMLKNGILHIESLSLDLLLFAGDRPIQPEPIDPHLVLEEVRDLLEESAAAKGVDIGLDCADKRKEVPLDRHAIHRAILNLATNAIDACVETGQGGLVTLKCRYGPDRVVLSVEDDGVGIPEAELGRITDRFYTTKPTVGTGLGLPVVLKIADQHGGTVEIESQRGEGSAFRLHLPVDPPEEAPDS